MADIIEVGKRIESARIELNLTQEELAKELGLNKSTIQRYETGKVQKIKIPIIESMARVLKVNPAWLSDKSYNRNVWESSNIDALPNDGIRLIPLYETVSAGFGAFA